MINLTDSELYGITSEYYAALIRNNSHDDVNRYLLNTILEKG